MPKMGRIKRTATPEDDLWVSSVSLVGVTWKAKDLPACGEVFLEGVDLDVYLGFELGGVSGACTGREGEGLLASSSLPGVT